MVGVHAVVNVDRHAVRGRGCRVGAVLILIAFDDGGVGYRYLAGGRVDGESVLVGSRQRVGQRVGGVAVLVAGDDHFADFGSVAGVFRDAALGAVAFVKFRLFVQVEHVDNYRDGVLARIVGDEGEALGGGSLLGLHRYGDAVGRRAAFVVQDGSRLDLDLAGAGNDGELASVRSGHSVRQREVVWVGGGRHRRPDVGSCPRVLGDVADYTIAVGDGDARIRPGAFALVVFGAHLHLVAGVRVEAAQRRAGGCHLEGGIRPATAVLAIPQVVVGNQRLAVHLRAGQRRPRRVQLGLGRRGVIGHLRRGHLRGRLVHVGYGDGDVDGVGQAPVRDLDGHAVGGRVSRVGSVRLFVVDAGSGAYRYLAR